MLVHVVRDVGVCGWTGSRLCEGMVMGVCCQTRGGWLSEKREKEKGAFGTSPVSEW